MAKVLLVADQLALRRTCCRDNPFFNMADAAAARTLCALYELVSMPALSKATSSHLARVDGCTGW